MFSIPKQIKQYTGRYTLVDVIPFKPPVDTRNSPALMTVFPIDKGIAMQFLPKGIHPFRLWKKALLTVAVIDCRETTIGKYVEYGVGIACTHGEKPAPRLLPDLFTGFFKTGLYVLDLPVSSEISVKSGKGVWGMPKHPLWESVSGCSCGQYAGASQTAFPRWSMGTV